MNTLTVRLQDTGRSQEELECHLRQLVDSLEQRGLASNVQITPVFPGDQSKWKGTFVVSSAYFMQDFEQVLNDFPGVEMAYVAPARGVISR